MCKVLAIIRPISAVPPKRAKNISGVTVVPFACVIYVKDFNDDHKEMNEMMAIIIAGKE